jgi:hypothetical protein
VFSDFPHRNVYEFASNKSRKVQGNENKGYKRSMWKYRMRKGNEGNVTGEREREREREGERERERERERKKERKRKNK